MPELPDLQVFARNLNKKLAGSTVKKLTVVNSKKLKTSAANLKKNIEKQELKEIKRVGKELHFEFKNGAVLGLHLMLKGQLKLFEGANEHKYTIIELLFDDDTGLAMTDFQGQATPTLNPEEREAPDALSDEINYSFLKEQLDTRATIKNILLDQHVIRGIGNAYADEILWDAGISPFSIGNKIPDSKIKALAKSIKSVLKNAEKQILKSDPDIISGEVRGFLDIHNSKKTHSPTGAAIKHAVVGSRKTYYTEEQELFK
jgi:formamidopyrimidine-DNA glycosylase